MVKVAALLQEPMVAVIVMVALMADVPVFLPVKAGIVPPLPPDGRPIAGLLLVHEKAAPAGVLVKLTGPMISLLHTVISGGTVIDGVGLIVIGFLTVATPQLLVTDREIVSLPGVLKNIFPGPDAEEAAGVPVGKAQV